LRCAGTWRKKCNSFVPIFPKGNPEERDAPAGWLE
jgi:hypothetical protein